MNSPNNFMSQTHSYVSTYDRLSCTVPGDGLIEIFVLLWRTRVDL